MRPRVVAPALGLVALLLTCPWVSTVFARETLLWGIERIHAQCVWDNNLDMTLDDGTNAGQNVTIAVIDSGVYYWEDSNGKHYHRDLEGNIVGGMGFEFYGGQAWQGPDKH